MSMMCMGFGVGQTAMDEILTELFHCDLYFVPGRSGDERYASALDEVEAAERTLRKALSPEHQMLMRDYQEKALRYQHEDCCLEFRRGFLLGAQLMLAAVAGKIEGRRR